MLMNTVSRDSRCLAAVSSRVTKDGMCHKSYQASGEANESRPGVSLSLGVCFGIKSLLDSKLASTLQLADAPEV